MKNAVKLTFVFLVGLFFGFLTQPAAAQTASCIGTASLDVVIEDCTDIEEVIFDRYYRLYPNPASHAVTILSTLPQQNATLQLVNMLGQIVMQEQFTGFLVLDISKLSSGIYFVAVQTEQNTAVKRIFVR
ncbi:MAG TPA: T9SS type A sorting domain-containing protein [Chitinophagales bacterium]|nr:T9SS type A sorting domain-containing protein [Chitinophagales bacterium]HRK27346.1 T9SS type A sorting domain-containing protein [Chitinophagales bacterium]